MTGVNQPLAYQVGPAAVPESLPSNAVDYPRHFFNPSSIVSYPSSTGIRSGFFFFLTFDNLNFDIVWDLEIRI